MKKAFEKLYEAADKNPGAILALVTVKKIITIVLVIILCAFVFHPLKTLRQVSKSSETVERQSEVVDAAKAYVTNETEDTTDVLQIYVDVMSEIRDAEEKIENHRSSASAWQDYLNQQEADND